MVPMTSSAPEPREFTGGQSPAAAPSPTAPPSSAVPPVPIGAAESPQPADLAPGPTGPMLSDDPEGLLAAGALRPVSEKLIPARYIAAISGYAVCLLLVVGAVAGAVLTHWWWLALLALIPVVILVQSLLFTPRRVRAIGYLDAEEDLTIASGILFRTVATIPYGRVQSVKIDEGPVDRRYGLAKLTVSTAADGSTVVLPGLPKQEAERLRALLADRGVSIMAAL
jgi:uncharacterized protein